MWIKVVIVVLFLGVILSLTGAFGFLMKDVGTRKRTSYLLGIRVTLAAAMIAVIWYGFASGQLRNQAPCVVLGTCPPVEDNAAKPAPNP